MTIRPLITMPQVGYSDAPQPAPIHAVHCRDCGFVSDLESDGPLQDMPALANDHIDRHIRALEVERDRLTLP